MVFFSAAAYCTAGADGGSGLKVQAVKDCIGKVPGWCLVIGCLASGGMDSDRVMGLGCREIRCLRTKRLTATITNTMHNDNTNTDKYNSDEKNPSRKDFLHVNVSSVSKLALSLPSSKRSFSQRFKVK